MQSFKPKARNDHGDSDPTHGNGWAILKTRNQITGAEFIHRGDESTFVRLLAFGHNLLVVRQG